MPKHGNYTLSDKQSEQARKLTNAIWDSAATVAVAGESGVERAKKRAAAGTIELIFMGTKRKSDGLILSSNAG
ncbi:MAG: hypothetical protein MUF87_10285 [Anaerolineae bacterium]|jgi:hypothetical protein|nr:hypothetical protein [Anaerolineae bacterium]